MHSYNFVSHSEEDTIKFADEFAAKLNGHSIIVLSGDLGSGKTKFTEGFLSYFNLDKEISSPTFTIVNEYKNEDISIFHFDVYRLEDVDEFYAIGGDEYFNSGISIIEWGELIKDALPKDYIEIVFHKDDNDENLRILDIYLHGNKYENII